MIAGLSGVVIAICPGNMNFTVAQSSVRENYRESSPIIQYSGYRRYILWIDAVEQFRKLMSSKDSDIALDLAVSLIAVATSEGIEVSRLMTRFDELAASVSCAAPQELVDSLFGSGRFTGNTIEYDDPRNSLIDQVLERRLGIPITLSVLAIEIGSRVGIEFVGIGMPGHFLCAPSKQNLSGSIPSYYDPFHGPAPLSATECQTLYQRLTSLENWSDEFLQTTSSRQIVIRILNNLKSIYLRRGDSGGIRTVMRLRTAIPELAAGENKLFAKLVRSTN